MATKKTAANAQQAIKFLSASISQQSFERSFYALTHNLQNTMTEDEIEKASLLCVNVIDKVENHFQKHVSISSGYRSEQVNKAVSKNQNSQHTKAEAVDFVIVGVSVEELYQYIKNNLVFDQIIHEGSWIHCSYRAINNRRECLRAFRGSYLIDNNK